MASRQEEKERRRREREEAEAAARASEARRKRLGIVLGGAALVAVIAIVVVAVLSSTGGGDGPSTNASGSTEPPKQQIDDLDEAAKAAGCKLETQSKPEGAGHTSEDQNYKANPPMSGAHDPVASREGIYGPDNPPDLEQTVHALEHGRINIQYREGTPENRIAQLDKLFEEPVQGIPGFKTLVFQNQTDMPYAVAATAWTRSLTCPEFNDQVFDAIRAFRRDFNSQGPEAIPSEFEQ